MAIFEEISAKMQAGKRKDVVALVNQALSEGAAPQDILNNGLLAGMDVISERFAKGELFVPEVLVAARAMAAGTDILKPLLVGGNHESKGKVVIATVKGDLHDIGKNMVKMMMESKGIEVFDLGADVTAEQFVAKAEEVGADIIACSAMLTTTMYEAQAVVNLLTEKGLKDKIKVMIGGAPCTNEFCELIKADAFTTDANAAAIKAVEFCA